MRFKRAELLAVSVVAIALFSCAQLRNAEVSSSNARARHPEAGTETSGISALPRQDNHEFTSTGGPHLTPVDGTVVNCNDDELVIDVADSEQGREITFDLEKGRAAGWHVYGPDVLTPGRKIRVFVVGTSGTVPDEAVATKIELLDN